MRSARHALPLVALAWVSMYGPATAMPAREDDRALQPFRAISERYHQEEAAVADGFLRTEVCVAEEGLGTMGYHYVNPSRVDRRLEFGRSEVLLYAQDDHGRRVLTGVEYIVVDEDQDLATDGDRPTLRGIPFQGPMPGHEPGMPVHYDLHVWAWHNNPAGPFAPWNTGLAC